MSKLIGYQENNFTVENGKEIRGYWLFLANEIHHNGAGHYVERLYCSEHKLKGRKLPPIGTDVMAYYNKQGKLQELFF